MTTVVVDSGDIGAIERHQPVDATTNPSLLLKAAGQDGYGELIDDALDWARGQSNSRDQRIVDACDRLAVNAGRHILDRIPGRVSTEVDARLSFDTEGTIAKAHRLVGLYDDAGIGTDRILIKIAATWEGIRAAEQLEREGIHCNITLLFAFEQAVAAADAGAFLISPFVGRIYDWYVANTDHEDFGPEDDPGVQSVRTIYDWYKRHGIDTVVMGASFRNTGQITALAGCDRLTISPDLLQALDEAEADLPRRLDDDGERARRDEHLDEKAFRWGLSQDAMATDKLAEGIRRFAADQVKLETMLGERL
jgi:transaldolase